MLCTGEALPEPGFNAKCRAIIRHLELLDLYNPGAPAVDCMRKRISWYGKTMGHCRPLKDGVRLADSTQAMRDAVLPWIQPDREHLPTLVSRSPAPLS
jgi:tRNA-dihydrouridine synthase